MKFRLLILGVLVHGLLLLWAFDVYSHTEEGKVSCPLASQHITRRLLFVIVRSPKQRGPVEGINNYLLSAIPNVVYFGEDSLPIYYNSSTNWLKAIYRTTWNNDLIEESYVNLDTFKEFVYKLKEKPIVFIIVLHDNIEEKTVLYIKHRLDGIRNMVDNYYKDNRSTCLIFYEQNQSLWSFGYETASVAGKQINSMALGPLISTLLNINTPYETLASLPLDFFSSARDKAYGIYCNALNTLNMAQKARQNIGLSRFLSKKNIQSDQVSDGNLTIERLLEEGNYTEALSLSKDLLNVSLSCYNNSVQIANISTFIFVTITLLGWMILLFTEYLEMLLIRTCVASSRNCIIHSFFVLLSLAVITVPFLLKWPYTYHFYFQMPVLIFWLISLRFKYLSYIKTKRENVYTFFLFLTILIFVEEYLFIEDEMLLPLSVCLVSMLPSVPTFRKVPYIFIIGWYVLSVLILCAIYLKKLPLVASTKYVNLSGTIWLMLAGIAILWISPKKDTIFTCFLTLCLGAAMWLQNACFVTNKNCHIVMYSIWPLLVVIILPAFGKSETLTKVIHCIIATGVPIMCTSTTVEPLMLLLVLGYTASWAAIESYYTISIWDNLRRMIILIYLFLLIEQLTATERLSFKCLICDINIHTEIMIYILSLVRLLIVYTSVLTTFRLILGSKLYSIAILASLVSCIASLRVLLLFTTKSLIYDQMDNCLSQHIRVNTMAIIFILGYIAAMIYARNNKHLNTPSIESFELTELS